MPGRVAKEVVRRGRAVPVPHRHTKVQVAIVAAKIARRVVVHPAVRQAIVRRVRLVREGIAGRARRVREAIVRRVQRVREGTVRRVRRVLQGAVAIVRRRQAGRKAVAATAVKHRVAAVIVLATVDRSPFSTLAAIGPAMLRIYHNNRCSKSRATLALLEQRGEPIDVINYLDTPPTTAELKRILGQLGIAPRGLMRSGEAEYRELGLDDPALDDESLIAAMVAHPKLIERPIVVANGKAAIGRPPEAILAIL